MCVYLQTECPHIRLNASALASAQPLINQLDSSTKLRVGRPRGCQWPKTL